VGAGLAHAAQPGSVAVNTTTSAVEWWRVAPLEPASAVPSAATEPRQGRVAFFALVIYTVILIAAPQEFFGVLAPLRIAMGFGVVALVAHAVDRLSGRVQAPRWPNAVKLALALVLWAVASIPFSYWPLGSVDVLLHLYLKSVAVFLLLAGVVDTTPRLRRLSGVLVGCAVLIALTALQHFRAGDVTAGSGDRIAGYGTSGMAGNPNDLALLLNIVIPINAMLCASARTTRAKVLLALPLLLSVAGIVVTFSRAGFLALAVTALLFLWRGLRRGALLPAGVVIASLLVLVLAAPAGYRDRLSTVSDISADQTGSAQNRWRDTQLAAGFALRHPVLGAGIGMDYLALNEMRGPQWISVHNIYLNYAMDLGLIGMALFVALFWSAYRSVARVERRRTRRDPRDALGLAATGVRISMVSFAVAAFFHPIAYHAFFYYLAGLAVAIARVDVIQGDRA
jgi:O-antigen ligase